MSSQGCVRVLFSSDNAFFAWDPMVFGVNTECLTWIRIHIAVADFELDTLRSIIQECSGVGGAHETSLNMRMMMHHSVDESTLSITVSVPFQSGSTVGHLRFLTLQDFRGYIHALVATAPHVQASYQSFRLDCARTILVKHGQPWDGSANATGDYSQLSVIDALADVAAISVTYDQ
ncbi:hypothetical protein ONZ51_g12984 [Trametes cubensis]|uniref:Uncharacterized protein n=1 Tax=Trametes cubensis TaxID=1111947 RepID=A0AAD7THC0_9APHY|nr:hypothetical protein ONZ51_g12984 [Trametes cubensis]